MRVNSQLDSTGNVFDLSRVLERVRVDERPVSKPRARIIDDFEGEVFDTSKRWPLGGFAPMTRISTSFGEVHAIALRPGDAVRTAQGEYKKIVWLDRVILDEQFLSGMPDANPMRITADAFGRGLPAADVMLSPRQLLSRNPRLDIQTATEIADLGRRPGVFRQPETGLSYTMFHVGEPADILCEGLVVRVEP